jgi:hypothetical protein
LTQSLPHNNRKTIYQLSKLAKENENLNYYQNSQNNHTIKRGDDAPTSFVDHNNNNNSNSNKSELTGCFTYQNGSATTTPTPNSNTFYSNQQQQQSNGRTTTPYYYYYLNNYKPANQQIQNNNNIVDHSNNVNCYNKSSIIVDESNGIKRHSVQVINL